MSDKNKENIVNEDAIFEDWKASTFDDGLDDDQLELNDIVEESEHVEETYYPSYREDSTDYIVGLIKANRVFFSSRHIDTLISKIRNGERIVLGENMPKNLVVAVASGELYYSPIVSVEVVAQVDENDMQTLLSNKDAIIVAFSIEKPKCVAVLRLKFFKKSDRSEDIFYKFEKNKCQKKTPQYVLYDTTVMSLKSFSFSPTRDVLVPILDYYHRQRVALDGEKATKVPIDLELLRRNYFAFSNLIGAEAHRLIVPVIGKPIKIKSLLVTIKNERGKEIEADKNLSDASADGLHDEEESYLQDLETSGIVLGKDESLMVLDLSELGETTTESGLLSLFLNENTFACYLCENLQGEKSRLDRVIAGINNVLNGKIAKEHLVEAVCMNNLDESCNHDAVYIPNEEYIGQLKEAYPILENNPEQLVAIDKVMQMESKGIDFLLIQGPPGTGKTELILSLAQELYKSNYNTLITSNVHVACNNIVERFKNNKEIVLKRYTATNGEQYAKELLENKVNYVKNQVLEGFCVENKVIDSKEAYDDVISRLSGFAEEEKRLAATKEIEDAKVAAYISLKRTIPLLENELDAIKEEEVSLNERITSLGEIHEKLKFNESVAREAFDNARNDCDVATRNAEAQRIKVDEWKEKLKTQLCVVEDMETHHASVSRRLEELAVKINDCQKSIDNKQCYLYFLQGLTNERIKRELSSIIVMKNEPADGYFEQLLSTVFDRLIKVQSLYDALKEDTAFWNNQADLSMNMIERLSFQYFKEPIFGKIFSAEVRNGIDDLFAYYRMSGVKKVFMNLFPFVKLNGKNKHDYLLYAQTLFREMKRFVHKIDDILFECVEDELGQKAIAQFVENTERVVRDLIGTKETLVLERSNAEDELKDLENACQGEKDKKSKITRSLAAATTSMTKCNGVLTAMQQVLAEKQEKYDFAMNALQQSCANIEVQKQKLVEIQNRRTAKESELAVAKAAMSMEYERNAETIAEYDVFISKFEIDIATLQNKRSNLQDAIDNIRNKVEFLKMNCGWNEEEAMEIFFNYAADLNRINEENDNLERVFFSGRSTVFDQMFTLSDNSGGALISMTTSQVAKLFRSTDTIKEFDYVIIDEASKCRFEDLIISLPKTKHLILIGDFMQLDPMFTSYDRTTPEIQKLFTAESWNNLNRSTFSNMLGKFVAYNRQHEINSFDDNPYVAVMKRQYRMNEGIFDLIKRIYAIHSEFELIDAKHQKANDVLCVQVDGKETRTGTSYYNDEEVSAIECFLKAFKEKRNEFSLVKTIGIITGYRPQEKRLRDSLKRIKFGDKCCEIGTIDRFQGREYDLVIVSLVRTDGFGFTDNIRRMNVALSRAKRHLLIVGNINALYKLSLRNIKSSYNDENSLESNEQEISFVRKDLIPELHRICDDYASADARTKAILTFMKENKYE